MCRRLWSTVWRSRPFRPNGQCPLCGKPVVLQASTRIGTWTGPMMAQLRGQGRNRSRHVRCMVARRSTTSPPRCRTVDVLADAGTGQRRCAASRVIEAAASRTSEDGRTADHPVASGTGPGEPAISGRRLSVGAVRPGEPFPDRPWVGTTGATSSSVSAQMSLHVPAGRDADQRERWSYERRSTGCPLSGPGPAQGGPGPLKALDRKPQQPVRGSQPMECSPGVPMSTMVRVEGTISLTS